MNVVHDYYSEETVHSGDQAVYGKKHLNYVS